ncbi:ATP-dependent helicase [Oceaniferula spumae]|uniref:ATP-dependent helicase n=1 Tax=Oceaniferula spumae TaxID=2979115 RepID=A0AAT9FRU0_9BACT
MIELPVHSLRTKLVEAVKSSGRVLLRAPTGSGKSTCVPPMLLDGGVEGLIVVVQPRRIAARLLARHVAALRGVKPGGEVGHVVRFENNMGKNTRIVYVTDGVLQRWLQENAELPGVGAVVFDEFHERRIASDVALARCLDLQEGVRKDLKLVVMSATLETGGLREYLHPCDVLEAEGRMFPVEIKYQAVSQTVQRGGNGPRQGLWDHAAAAIKQELGRDDTGHILVFLPGVHEIRRTVEIVERASWSRGWKVCPLYSGLSPKLQDEAVAPNGSPRIIVSTNVAETSLTIDGVCTVIDAGLARVARYDAVRGIDTLMIEKISRASADQRAGRAGRTAPGKCLRLWSENDHGRRDAFELPEIKRVDLAEVVLSLKAAGVEDVADFRWLEKPDEHALEVANKLLHHLGALDALDEITEQGQAMARFPLHPRYARLLLAGQQYDCVAEAGFIAAAVQSEGVFLRGKGGPKEFSDDNDLTDFAAEWRAFNVARDMRYDPRRCGDYGIMARGARELEKSLSQLEKLATRAGIDWKPPRAQEFNQQAVSRAVLAALSDRLAAQLGEATLSCRVVGNRKGKIDAESVAKGAEAFVAAEMTEVEGKEVSVYLNRCTKISLKDLQTQFPDDFSDHRGASYDPVSRRVLNLSETRFRDLVLTSKEGGEPPLDQAAHLLAERVVSGELKLNKWDKFVEQWIARLVNLTNWMPEMELPGFSEDDHQLVIEEVCQGAKSYKDIKNREVLPVLSKWLSAPQKSVLDAYAPTEVKISNGKTAKVKYKIDAEPWIAMKMQHLYDVTELPKIANGKVNLLVHLLAPNQRPWQVTGDLKGFWERGYPQMKKDLAGRYPKHEWR